MPEKMMFRLIRKFLFQFDPETAHHLALNALQLSYRLGLSRFLCEKVSAPKEVMGLPFLNSVGLAAGFDRNGEYVDALAALGFGFIEIGTVTPQPQAGNQRPRIFRLPDQEAIINRVGFASKGMEYVKQRLEQSHYSGILGINIGKNRDTPIERALDDYLACFISLYRYASYITINISSPNTPNLRDLHERDALMQLLTELKTAQKKLAASEQKYVPLVVKISPDLTAETLRETAAVLLATKIDGVIATNTTVHRNGIPHSELANESGGLSGRPLHKHNLATIKALYAILENKIPIIASGGVMDETTADEKRAAGAALLQLYAGFIYAGPGLITRLV